MQKIRRRRYRESRNQDYTRFLESLESRLLLSSTLLPLTDHKDLVVDSSRNQLLVIGSTGIINRYDITNNQLLTPITLGASVGGADISPDGQYLYVPLVTPAATLTLDRINLDTGVIDSFTTPVSPSAGFFDCVALADGRVELTTIAPGQVQVFCVWNPATGSITLEPALNTSYQTHEPSWAFRSADRQTAVFMEPTNTSNLTNYSDPGGVRLFSLPGNSETQLRSGLGLALNSSATAAVNRDGSVIALGLDNGIFLLNPSGSTLSAMTQIRGNVYFSPSADQLLVTDMANSTLDFFDVTNPAQPLLQRQMKPNELGVGVGTFVNGQLALSPDGSKLFLTSSSGVWVLDTPVHNWTAANDLTLPASATAFSTLTLTAAVTTTDPAAGTVTPSGWVAFYDTSAGHLITYLGTATLVNGTATLSATGLSAGTHTIGVAYNGDTNFTNLPLANKGTLVISKFVPTVTLQAVNGVNGTTPIATWQDFRITVSPAPPDRIPDLTLFNALTGDSLGGSYMVNGNTTISVVNMAPGDYQLRADFAGSADLASASAYLTVSVVKATPTLSITPLATGSFTLSVPFTSNSGFLPSGTVSLMESGQVIMTTTISGASSSFDLHALAAGTHTLTALYAGDDHFLAATSSTVQVVVPLAVTTQLSTPRYSVNQGETIQLTAAESPATSGLMTFYAGNTQLGVVSVTNGTATWSYTMSKIGSQNFSATFESSEHVKSTATAVVSAYKSTVIDILALYTVNELQAEGSVQKILSKLNQQITDANTVLSNSLLNVSVRLASLMPENYSEVNDMATDWDHLSNPSDGVMDNVTGLRTKVGADLVILLDAQSTPWGGGSVTEGEGSILTQAIGNDTSAFIVVSEAADLKRYVLIHEIGHTFGVAHAIDDPTPDGLTAYAHGYRFNGTNGVTYRDIMAYDPGQIVPYFSNPNITYQGVPLGNAATADGARVITMTAPRVSAYRNAVPFGAITSSNGTTISGWAIDGKALNSSLNLSVTIDGVFAGSLVAGEGRAELLTQYGASNHGFTYTLPHTALGTHIVNIYALDAASGTPSLVATTSVSSDHYVFGSPGTLTAGQNLGSLTVSVADPSGNVASNYRGTLTLSLASAPDDATISGTTTAVLINGIATFTNISLTRAGTYTLQATDGILTAPSSKIIVVPEALSSHLQLDPSALAGSQVVVGKPLAPIVVWVVDQYGNVVATDKSPITLSIADGPGTLKGTTTLTALNGFVTFKNIIPTTAGSLTLAATPASTATIADKSAVQWSQTILNASTTVGKVAVNSAGYNYGFAVTLSSTLVSSTTTAGPFNGSAILAIEDGSNFPGSLTGTGSAKFLITGLSAGTYSGAVVYLGDANHAAATGSSFTISINRASSTAALVVTPAATVYGQPVTLTATLGPPPTGTLARTGTVIFRDGITPIGTVTLSGTTAALTLPTPPIPPTVGSHVYSAVYSGDGNWKAITSANKSLVVKKDNVTITLTASPPPVGPTRVVGETFTLDAQVLAIAPGAAAPPIPTGLVTFKDGTKILGTALLDDTGHATWTGSLPTTGTHSLTATYAGDPLCNSKVSAKLLMPIVAL